MEYRFSMFANIRVVLVNTSHPGNIGAVARAMKTMCLDQLYLVDPKLFPHADATARASGADDVLASARVCETLEEAIQDCSLVFGASSRSRRIAWPQLVPRACAQRIISEPDHSSIAIIFGREHSGLTNDELEFCHYLVNIPANEEYSSLNIAAAVQVIVYEIMLAKLADKANQTGSLSSERDNKKDEMSKSISESATAEDIEGLFQHMEQALIDMDFLDPDNPRQLMRRLRRLFNRTHLEKTEVNILRGIFTATQRSGQQSN